MRLTADKLERIQFGTGLYTEAAFNVFKVILSKPDLKYRAKPGYPIDDITLSLMYWPNSARSEACPGVDANGEVVLKMKLHTMRELINSPYAKYLYGESADFVMPTCQTKSQLLIGDWECLDRLMCKWLESFQEVVERCLTRGCVEIHDHQYIHASAESPVEFIVDGETVPIWLQDVALMQAHFSDRAKDDPPRADYSRVVGKALNPLESMNRSLQLMKFAEVAKKHREKLLDALRSENLEHVLKLGSLSPLSEAERSQVFRLLERCGEELYAEAAACGGDIDLASLKHSVVGAGSLACRHFDCHDFYKVMLGWA